MQSRIMYGSSRGGRALMLTGLVVVGAVFGCGGSSSARLAGLPLTGETKGGQRWRLEAGRPVPGDDVKASWCLRLRYTKVVVVDDDPFVGGAAVCGARPARRVSGHVVVDCARNAVFIFGGARSVVHSVTLHLRRGPVLHAVAAKLPPGSGFRGQTFMLVADARRLPARVEASGAGERVLMRLPRRGEVCAPFPGAPEGGEPAAEFESKR